MRSSSNRSARAFNERVCRTVRRAATIISQQELLAMQMIEAVIKPHKLDAVKTALARVGILGVTAVECKGFGRQMGHTERYRGARMDVGFVPKVLLKLCVRSDETEKALRAIVDAARSGEVGDGKIFVYPIQQVVRIRTGETNEQAL
jgi:nitrogen regulatory protein PII